MKPRAAHQVLSLSVNIQSELHPSFMLMLTIRLLFYRPTGETSSVYRYVYTQICLTVPRSLPFKPSFRSLPPSLLTHSFVLEETSWKTILYIIIHVAQVDGDLIARRRRRVSPMRRGRALKYRGMCPNAFSEGLWMPSIAAPLPLPSIPLPACTLLRYTR